jgi:hypothetical protein
MNPHQKHFTHRKKSRYSGGGIVHQRKAGHPCGDINCTIPPSIIFDGEHWCIDQSAPAGRSNERLARYVQGSLRNSNGEESPTNIKTISGYE